MVSKGTLAEFDGLYKKGDFTTILGFENGLNFFKLRSMSRKDILEKFCKENKKAIPKKSLFEFVFNENFDESLFDVFIKKEYDSDANSRAERKTKLYQELYKMDTLDWGGLYQNGLETGVVAKFDQMI